GDDDVLVPVALLDPRLDFLRISEPAGDLLGAATGPRHFFAAVRDDSAPARAAGLVVKNARIDGAGLDVRLVAGRHECADGAAAVLDPRVGETGAVVGGNAVREAQLEVIDNQVLAGGFRDQERVRRQPVVRRGAPGQGAVLHRPEFRAAGPAREASA